MNFTFALTQGNAPLSFSQTSFQRSLAGHIHRDDSLTSDLPQHVSPPTARRPPVRLYSYPFIVGRVPLVTPPPVPPAKSGSKCGLAMCRRRLVFGWTVHRPVVVTMMHVCQETRHEPPLNWDRIHATIKIQSALFGVSPAWCMHRPAEYLSI